MASRKPERLLNLVICLLVTRRFLTRDQIRESVEGYAELTAVAFRRAFERDKDELRRLGVPLEVGSAEDWGGVVDGYRIRRGDFELPVIELTGVESTLVGLATRVWQEATLDAATGRAIAKLTAGGVGISPERLVAVAPSLPTREAGFAVFWQGWLTRSPIRFVYHGRRRDFEPWQLVLRQASWYALGRDRTAGVRAFKLSRVEGQPVLLTGQPPFPPPDPAELAAHRRLLEAPEPVHQALVAIRPDTAPALRRRGRPAEGRAPEGYNLVAVPYARPDEIVGEAAAAGADALVLKPLELRAQVLERLRQVAAAGQPDQPATSEAATSGPATSEPAGSESITSRAATAGSATAAAVGVEDVSESVTPGSLTSGSVGSAAVGAEATAGSATAAEAGAAEGSGAAGPVVAQAVPATSRAARPGSGAMPGTAGKASEAVDQVARLLLLIPYLQSHPGISLSQAAAALGLAPEQVRGDLAVAFMCGLPGGLPGDLIEIDLDLVDDEGVVYLSNAEVLSRPLRLNPDEAMGLIVALRAVRQVAAGDLHQVIDTLLAKLAAVAPGPPPTPPALELAAGLDTTRERLFGAISQAQRVRLTYYGASRGQTSRPLVDPARLFTSDGVAYLSAWSVGRDAWRTYRLDRIAAVEPTGDLAQAHGREPAADSWLQTLAQARPVRLRVRPAAQWMVEYYPTQGLTRLPDGDLEVTLPVADPAWLRWLLLRLGPDVTLLDDPAAAADAAQAATAALAAYAAAGLA